MWSANSWSSSSDSGRWNSSGESWKTDYRSSPAKKPFSVFESDSSKGQKEEEEDDKMSDAGSHASEQPTGASAVSRDANMQALANAKCKERYGRSQAMKAAEDFIEA